MKNNFKTLFHFWRSDQRGFFPALSLFTLAFLLASTLQVTAQTEEETTQADRDSLVLLRGELEDPTIAENRTACKTVGVKSESYVEFESTFSASFELERMFNPSVNIVERFGRTRDMKAQVGEDGVLTLENLAKGQEFLIEAQNSCGEMVGVYHFDTNPGKNGGGENPVISLPKASFDLMRNFGAQEKDARLEVSLPLHDYLNQKGAGLNEIQLLEVYQKTKMGGVVYSDDVKRTKKVPKWPPVGPPDPDPDPVECECYVLTLNEDITPGAYSSTSWHYTHKGQITIDQNNDVGTNAEVWSYKNSKGAAKWQYSQSDGWKNKPCSNHYGSSVGGSEGGAADMRFENKSEITLTLVCNDGNDLPSECACGKTVYFDYQYDAKVRAFSKTLGGAQWCGGKRETTSNAKDFSVVYCAVREAKPGQGDVLRALKILDKRELSAAASCKVSVNPNFFSTWGDFADVLISEYANFQSGGLTGTENTGGADATDGNNFSVGTIGAALDQVWNTSYHEENDCNNEAVVEKTMDGKFSAQLLPNLTLSFYIRSHAETRTRGRRSWFSNATAVSNSAMAVTVTPGLTSGVNEECCTPWAAIWSGSGYYGTLSWQIMGPMLHAHYMTDCFYWENGHPYSYGDYGSCTRPATTGDCEVIVSGPGTRH